MTINIAKDYSDTPLGRYPADGTFSGERFREEFLVPALRTSARVNVEIDGVEGYGSSFLEEAFGGLVRKHGFSALDLKRILNIVSNDPEYELYRGLIWRYIADAKPE